MSVLLYGCTTWILTKYLDKKLDGNYIKMLEAVLNKSWKQHPIKTADALLLTSHLTNHSNETN